MGKSQCVGTEALCQRKEAVRTTHGRRGGYGAAMVFVWCGWYCLHAAYCTCMVHTDSLMRGLEGLTRRKHRTH